jgi:ring-1,2-phenylacetyl-CoA epoxidase subunit PaaD
LEKNQIHIIRKKIAGLLHEVSDPEIPIVSIVDLGMVIDIRPENSHWRIDLAPTYSGCPAIDVIPIIVKTHLAEAGFEDIHIEMEITPPWSTDWISEEGSQKLLAYGIAPPNGRTADHAYEGKPRSCPQCGSAETELISNYGATPCKASYKCLSCLEPFEYFKCF